MDTPWQALLAQLDGLEAILSAPTRHRIALLTERLAEAVRLLESAGANAAPPQVPEQVRESVERISKLFGQLAATKLQLGQLLASLANGYGPAGAPVPLEAGPTRAWEL